MTYFLKRRLISRSTLMDIQLSWGIIFLLTIRELKSRESWGSSTWSPLSRSIKNDLWEGHKAHNHQMMRKSNQLLMRLSSDEKKGRQKHNFYFSVSFEIIDKLISFLLYFFKSLCGRRQISFENVSPLDLFDFSVYTQGKQQAMKPCCQLYRIVMAFKFKFQSWNDFSYFSSSSRKSNKQPKKTWFLFFWQRSSSSCILQSEWSDFMIFSSPSLILSLFVSSSKSAVVFIMKSHKIFINSLTTHLTWITLKRVRNEYT